MSQKSSYAIIHLPGFSLENFQPIRSYKNVFTTGSCQSLPLSMHSTLWKFSTTWKMPWNFLTKFLRTDQLFSRNIFTSLSLISETSAYAQLTFFDIGPVENLHWGFQIASWMLSHNFSWKYFLVCNFYLKVQPLHIVMRWPSRRFINQLNLSLIKFLFHII